MKPQTRIRVIVPVYNEAHTLPTFLARLRMNMETIKAKLPCELSVVFVNDGSGDRSCEIIKNFSFGKCNCEIIELSRNFGKEAALSAGIDACDDVDAAIMIDADLEHPPELMQKLIETWLETRADSVFYYKEDRQKAEGLIKSVFSVWFYRLMNSGTNYKLFNNAGDFRIMGSKFIQALQSLPENQRFLKGLYGWIGFHQVGIAFTPGARQNGKSNYPPIALFLLALNGLTSFSVTPLRMMMVFGVIISGLSILYGVFIAVEALLFPGMPPGTASVLSLIAFFSGIQLLCLGLIGEYIGRILSESKRRPAYIVKEHTHIGSEQDASDDHR